jgi:hypothetical protein
VAFLIARHLGGTGNRRRKALLMPLGDRQPYEIAVTLTLDEKAKLEQRAERERRSVSSYVARLIAHELR